MKEILLEEIIERESGWLYFVDGSGSVCRSPMARGGKKGIKKPRSKTKEELRILDNARKKKWRDENERG